MALDIPTVLQTQGPEGLVGQLTRQMTLQLVSVLSCAGTNKAAVEVGIAVHAGRREACEQGDAVCTK
jgi:hypothetical protein